MKEITCPYCDYDFDLNHDDGAYYEEYRRRECVCPKCEKTFMVESSISWTFTAEKADCLNGGSHKWEDRLSGRKRCALCDKIIYKDNVET